MQRLQAFKFELMPNGEQARNMRCFAGSCRFVYNKALAMQKDHYAQGGRFIGYVAIAANCRSGSGKRAQTGSRKRHPRRCNMP
jgi:transposase